MNYNFDKYSSFQNIMTFNKCSIAGRSFGDIIDPRTGESLEINEVSSPFFMAFVIFIIIRYKANIYSNSHTK